MHNSYNANIKFLISYVQILLLTAVSSEEYRHIEKHKEDEKQKKLFGILIRKQQKIKPKEEKERNSY